MDRCTFEHAIRDRRGGGASFEPPGGGRISRAPENFIGKRDLGLVLGPLDRERMLQQSAIHRAEDVTALYYAGRRIHDMEMSGKFSRRYRR